MKDGKVLQFPKEQTTRARLRNRASSQRAGLALSILSVLTLSVVLNQWLTKPSPEATNAGRGIASYEAAQDEDTVRWEHELALQLSSNEHATGHIAEKPSMSDELIFGALEGRYGAKLQDGRVTALDFAAGDSAGALRLMDREGFLLKFREAFAISFKKVSLISSAEGLEVWGLFDSDKTQVGSATFGLDHEGHVSTVRLAR